MNLTSKRACSDSDTNCEGEKDYPKQYKKVLVHFKDTLNNILNFTNLQEVGLYRSKRIVEKVLTSQNRDFVYNLFTNYSSKPAKPTFESKTMMDRVFYT